MYKIWDIRSLLEQKLTALKGYFGSKSESWQTQRAKFTLFKVVLILCVEQQTSQCHSLLKVGVGTSFTIICRKDILLVEISRGEKLVGNRIIWCWWVWGVNSREEKLVGNRIIWCWWVWGAKLVNSYRSVSMYTHYLPIECKFTLAS